MRAALILASALLVSSPAFAQVDIFAAARAEQLANPIDIFAQPMRTPMPTPVTVPPVVGPMGPMGPQGPQGPQGPVGPQGPASPGVVTWWPVYRPHLDVLQDGYTVVATVPRPTGIHDKVMYNPHTKTAVLLDMRDGYEPRCYQLLPEFHPNHVFTAITVDATRTFTWHDATGLWTLDWPTVACVPF
jgi:hypothetical protein